MNLFAEAAQQGQTSWPDVALIAVLVLGAVAITWLVNR